MGTRSLLALYRETLGTYTCYRFNTDGFAELKDLYEKLVACATVEEVNALIVTLLKEKRMELYDNRQVYTAPPDSQKCWPFLDFRLVVKLFELQDYWEVNAVEETDSPDEFLIRYGEKVEVREEGPKKKRRRLDSQGEGSE